jgi:hypothetical protein
VQGEVGRIITTTAAHKRPCKRLETCISMWKERVGGLKRVPLNRPRIEQF